jgi:predicted SAM-dependent methyltransferase
MRDPQPRTAPVVDAGEHRRLNWGCGSHVAPGWINSDIKDEPGIDLVCDIRQGLPLETASIDCAVSIHALPEFCYPEIVPALEELRRVLKPGATLRLALPDLQRGIAAYQSADDDYFQVDPDEVRSRGGRFVVHMLWYGYSRTLFTADFALELLEKAGFVDLNECLFGVTASKVPEIVELDNRERESLFVEGRKPLDPSLAAPKPPSGRVAWHPAGRGYNSAVARRERIKVIKVVEVSGADAEGDLRASHLDSPTADSELDSNALKIVGWAVGKVTPVESVEIVAADEVVATAPVEIERPGVAATHEGFPGADRAGFRLVVEGSGAGRHDLEVRGVLDNGRRAPIGAITLEIRRRGLLSRLARFGDR